MTRPHVVFLPDVHNTPVVLYGAATEVTKKIFFRRLFF